MIVKSVPCCAIAANESVQLLMLFLATKSSSKTQKRFKPGNLLSHTDNVYEAYDCSTVAFNVKYKMYTERSCMSGVIN